MRLLRFSVVLALLAPLQPAQALPPLANVHTFENPTGGGWAAYRFTSTPGMEVEWVTTPTLLDSHAYGEGGWLLDAEGEVVFGLLVTGHSGVTKELRIVGPDPAGVLVDEQSGGMWGNAGSSVRFTFQVDREWIILPMVAGHNLVSATMALNASEGLVLDAVTTGSEVFFHQEADFREGGINVGAGGCAIGYLGCVKAKLIAVATATSSISNLAYAVFSSGIEAASTRLDTPAGPGEPVVGGSQMVAKGTPGRYAFHVDLNAGSVYSGLSAWGADVRLPT